MIPPLPKDLAHHATMLSDTRRLDAYRAAIQEVIRSSDCVVDIGAGTGILSAMAANGPGASVDAVEYFQESAQTMRALLKNSKLQSKIRVINESSYRLKLDGQPNVLLTETMGAVGPEENIVELCHDFKKRHPSIETLIPNHLRMMAVPVVSGDVEAVKRAHLDAFLKVHEGDFDFGVLALAIECRFASQFLCLRSTECSSVGPVSTLADYRLGYSANSSFASVVDVSDFAACNAVHVYFEADLSPGVRLSTHFNEMITHWKHNFVPRPEGANRLAIEYRKQEWSLKWA